jgi:putative tryptophan/tyrosine transport system substrate-binding protein
MRDLLAVVLAVAAMTASWVAEAQQTKGIPRVGFLGNGSASTSGPLLEAFRAGLRDFGYVEGRNVIVDVRYVDGMPERVQPLVHELLALSPDVVVAAGPQPLRTLKQTTTSIPVVMAIISDPVEEGLIASLARPGGNMTGLAFQNQALTAKRLELLKEAVPKVSRVAVLWDTSFGLTAGYTQAEAAARTLQLRLQPLRVRRAADLEPAFASAATGHTEAVLVLASPFLNAHRHLVIELAARHRLPATYEASTFVAAGGLMSYGPSFSDMYRRAAVYVDKILKGSKPADLPVEQPTKFELAINRKTAQALGLAIPSSLLLRVDHIVE